MDLVIDKVDDVVLVSLGGQMNSGNASAIEADLISQMERGEHRMVLDLSLLGYISSAGLRVILLLAKRLKQEQGKLVLCGLQSRVREVFDISGFLGILTVVDTREEALRLASASAVQSRPDSW